MTGLPDIAADIHAMAYRMREMGGRAPSIVFCGCGTRVAVDDEAIRAHAADCGGLERLVRLWREADGG
jgi:hypothetical protein